MAEVPPTCSGYSTCGCPTCGSSTTSLRNPALEPTAQEDYEAALAKYHADMKEYEEKLLPAYLEAEGLRRHSRSPLGAPPTHPQSPQGRTPGCRASHSHHHSSHHHSSHHRHRGHGSRLDSAQCAVGCGDQRVRGPDRRAAAGGAQGGGTTHGGGVRTSCGAVAGWDPLGGPKAGDGGISADLSCMPSRETPPTCALGADSAGDQAAALSAAAGLLRAATRGRASPGLDA